MKYIKIMDSIINGSSGAGAFNSRVGEVNGKEFRNKVSLSNKLANFNIGSEISKIKSVIIFIDGETGKTSTTNLVFFRNPTSIKQN